EITAKTPQPLPIDVLFVEEEITAKTPQTPRSEIGLGRSEVIPTHRSGALSSSELGVSAGVLAVDPSASERHGGLRMRGGVDLGLDGDDAERIASAPGPRNEEGSHHSGRVVHRRDGTAVVYDAVTRMEIARDGGVTFHDKPDIDIKFRLP